IEPSAGVNWSRTFIDPVNLSTTTTLSQLPAFPSFPGLDFSNVRIASFDNLTGRASIRVGTTFPYGQYIFQPFATASVLHEFADPISSQVNTLDVAPGGGFFLQSGLFSTARIGTYGQFGLGVAEYTADSGWTSFVRSDYRVGSRFNGWSVAGGARYSFNPEVGVAREGRSAEPAAALPAPAPYNWSGFFVGASAPGALWGDTNWSSGNTRGGGEAKVAGLLAGGGGGYNYQLGQVVIGGQAEWDWSNARGGNSFSCPGDFGGFDFPSRPTFRPVLSLSSFGCEARVNSIFTATARAGYAFDRLLIYGQGGLAVGDIAAKSVTTMTTLNALTTPPSIVSIPTTVSASKTSVGWTIGAGFEYGLTQNISAKAEYLYFDLGSDTYNLGVPVAINRTGNIGRVGLNYRFNLM
ncbi:MAG TPA: outer membrane beta-barrel protein, partial [Gemmataceae bacterium]|nr:outer membrane beta-barrel protein [Gemmataceae bacterium]